MYKIIWKIVEKISSKNINIKENWLYLMFLISTKSNIILYTIISLEKIIYKWKLKKLIIISFLIPLKFFIYYIYQISHKLRIYTIYEIIVKRAFGLILSVLIFTNIIQFLGGRINYIIFIYLVIVIWNIIKPKEYQENNQIQGNLWNIDILKIWEIKTEANMFSYIIKQKWAQKTEIEKLEFLKKYKINEVWLNTLQVQSISVLEIVKKWKIINKKDLNFGSYDLHLEYEYYRLNVNINQLFLISILKELMEQESELEYLILLDKNKKDDIIDLIKEHNVENVNIEELLEYNNIMLKAILYYFWDLQGQNTIQFKIDCEIGLTLVYKLQQEENLTIENYVKKYVDKNLSLSIENYRKLYEINLFIDFSKLIYIHDTTKYEKYINFYKLNNVIIDTSFIRINTIEIDVYQEINKKWEKILENKIKKYEKEYKKDKYLEYFDKL